ncbi:GTP-binding protein, partial [candidate division WOR-3 bacterium]|nr:GTP-binding protein [candidate division WOR-3 bacterium]
MAIKGIRTIGFFGHASSGKTTIADAFLFLAGANTRFGKVSEKTSAFDCDPEEMERACSLNLGLATFDYKDIIINLIDTPGYSDFIGEAISGVQAVDCAVMVIDAVAGIEVGTERLLKKIEEKNLPLIFFINKLKKEDADYYKIFSAISEITKRSIVPLTIPMGEAEKFSGVADIIKNKGFGAKGKEEEIPAQIKEKVSQYTDKIIEAAADTDEALMNKYIEGQKIEMSECLDVMKKGITEGKVALCLAGDALELIGIQNLIDTVIEFMPQSDLLPDIEIDSQKIKRSDDSPFLGYVFKTTVEPHVGELCYLKVLSGSIKSGDIVKNSTKSSDEKINQIFSIKGKEKKETSQLTSGMIGGLVKLK